jgi:site-specific DNA-cytosine methylase
MVQLWGNEWEIQWEVLNTKNFGLPQNRERVFIIARHIGKGSRRKILPIGFSKCLDNGAKTYNNITSRTISSLFERIGQGHLAFGFAPDGTYIYDATIDRLRTETIVECERLQGYIDNWTKGISKKERYKCLGNAVSVNVIRAIVEKIDKEQL